MISAQSDAHESVIAEEIVAGLSAQDINVSRSVPSSTLLDSTRRKLPAVVRVSPHYYNTEDELERFLSSLRILV